MTPKLTKRTRYIISYISETLLWIVLLIFPVLALAWTSNPEAPTSSYIFTICAFFVYALIFLHHGWRNRAIHLFAITDLVSAGAMLIAGIVFVILPGGPVSALAATLFFYGLFVLRRIPRLVAYHKPRNIVFAILNFILLGSLIWATVDEWMGGSVALSFMILDFIIMAIAIANILAIAFSRIRLGPLLKIIRKTFVGEILFGLVTLIFVFALLFYSMEGNFPSYGDALWYCFAVVTTIGFGDFTTTGLIGRLLSVILGIYGIIVVAAITSVIVNFYQETAQSKETQSDESPLTMDEIAHQAQKDLDKKDEESGGGEQE